MYVPQDLSGKGDQQRPDARTVEAGTVEGAEGVSSPFVGETVGAGGDVALGGGFAEEEEEEDEEEEEEEGEEEKRRMRIEESRTELERQRKAAAAERERKRAEEEVKRAG